MDRINHMANNDSSEYTPTPGPLLKNIQIPADLKTPKDATTGGFRRITPIYH